MSTSAVLLDYLILWRIFMLSPCPPCFHLFSSAPHLLMCWVIAFLCGKKLSDFSNKFFCSFKTSASERAVETRSWASASLWYPLLRDEGFYLPHPSFQKTHCIHCPRLPKSRLSYRSGFRHNQAYMAQWVQFWSLAEMGSKQKLFQQELALEEEE